MDFLEKIDFLMKRDGLNRHSLSIKSGIPYTTIDGWYKRGYEGLKMPTLMKLCDFFQTTLDYLTRDEITDPDYGKASGFKVNVPEMAMIKKYRILDVHGKRVVDGVLELEYGRMTHVVEKEQKGWVTYINVYDLALSASTGEPWGGPATPAYKLEFPTEQVPNNAHFCARVNGNSMEPEYKDGDVVFVQKIDGSVRESEIGIFSVDGEGYMKILGQNCLESINPDYSPIPFHEGAVVICQGRVLGKVPEQRRWP